MREQYSANHFCKIVKQLNPRIAMPFSPGFVLLDDSKRWINDVKFPREELNNYYHRYFDSDSSIQFPILYPGDFVEDDVFVKSSPYYNKMRNGSINYLVDEIYADEIAAENKAAETDNKVLNDLLPGLLFYLNDNKKIYHTSVLKKIKFAIFLKDLKEPVYINVDFGKNDFDIYITTEKLYDRKLIVTTSFDLLSYSLSHVWAGDALTIGYGIDVEVFEEESLEKNLDIICVRLLCRYPQATDYLFKQPLRKLKYIVSNPVQAKLTIKQKLHLRNAVNKFPYNERDHWIGFTKCELCRVCNMPLLSFEFGERQEEELANRSQNGR